MHDLDDVVALPGAVEVMSLLPEDRRGIATSARRNLMEARLGAAGIPLPQMTVAVDDVTRGKPDPEPFLVAAERLGHDPSDVLVVEDSISGLTGAKAAGCATLAVVTTTSAEKLAVSGLADGVVKNLSEVAVTTSERGVQIGLR